MAILSQYRSRSLELLLFMNGRDHSPWKHEVYVYDSYGKYVPAVRQVKDHGNHVLLQYDSNFICISYNKLPASHDSDPQNDQS